MKQLIALLMMGFTLAANAQFTGTWAAAPEFTGPGDMPATSLAGRSIRQVVHVSLGGDKLRMQLSNEFSATPVEIRSVFIADAKDSCDIDVKSARYLTFGGKRNVTIAAGEALFSDIISYPLKPLQHLSITVSYGSQVPENATSHRGSRTTSYIISGQAKPKTRFIGSEKVDHWYNIAAIDICHADGNDGDVPCVAVLGNSITDGRGSTTNQQNRWTDFLAEALQGETGVLNLGIGGNCVLEGGLSEPALKRFERDILRQRGVKTLVIFEGVNDIGGSNGNSEQTAARLIAAYQHLTELAHAAGMKVYIGTITPFYGNSYFTIFHEAARQVVNEWIRTAGIADGIVDFDRLTRNPEKPEQLLPAYSDDWLHLNPTGYEAMGKYAATIIK